MFLKIRRCVLPAKLRKAVNSQLISQKANDNISLYTIYYIPLNKNGQPKKSALKLTKLLHSSADMHIVNIYKEAAAKIPQYLFGGHVATASISVVDYFHFLKDKSLWLASPKLDWRFLRSFRAVLAS